MRRVFTLFAIACGFALLLLPKLSAEDNPDAAALFKKNCVMCHKADGKGYEAMHSPDFTSKEWQASKTDEELIASVTNGKKDKGTMPPFGEKLKPEEIKLLVTDVVRKFAQESGNQEPEKEKKEPEK
jgi:mono/diheme cytochrome c family protein